MTAAGKDSPAPACGWIALSRLSLNQMTTLRASFIDDVLALQQAGLRTLGVWRQKLIEYGEERAVDLLRDSGVRVSSLSWAGGFTGADGLSYREALHDAQQALRTASELESASLTIVTGPRARFTHNHARRLVSDALRALGDMAGELGIHLCLQAVPRNEGKRWTFLHTVDAALDLLGKCDHPQLGLLFDTHQLSHEPALLARLPELVPFIRSVALCDSQADLAGKPTRCLPGRGSLPLLDIIVQLEQAGYRGYYEAQVLSRTCWDAIPAEVAQDCADLLRQLQRQFRIQQPEAETRTV